MINKFVPHQGAQKSDACQGHLPERLKFIGDHDIQMFILEALVLYSIDRQYIESAKHQKTGKLMEIDGNCLRNLGLILMISSFLLSKAVLKLLIHRFSRCN